LLTARGQVTQALLAFLLKAYKRVPDNDFSKYIHAKQNKYKEGHDLNPTSSSQANNKYKSLVQANTWNAPPPELPKTMAPEATIEQHKKKGKPNNDNKSKGKGNGGKSKGKKGKKGERDKLLSWMSKGTSQEGLG